MDCFVKNPLNIGGYTMSPYLLKFVEHAGSFPRKKSSVFLRCKSVQLPCFVNIVNVIRACVIGCLWRCMPIQSNQR